MEAFSVRKDNSSVRRKEEKEINISIEKYRVVSLFAFRGMAFTVLAEVAAGTGRNFEYYPTSCSVIATDNSPAMVEICREKAAGLGKVCLAMCIPIIVRS